MTYEVLTIHHGEETVLLTTENKKDAASLYVKLNCGRLRVDGVLYTIREADEACGIAWYIPGYASGVDGRKCRYQKIREAAARAKMQVNATDYCGNVMIGFSSVEEAARYFDVTEETVISLCDGHEENDSFRLEWAQEGG